jgi:hypothetical protein
MDSLILADSNQPKEINVALEKWGYSVVTRRLRTADYIWTVPGGRAGCEVKDFLDLLQSHRNGRLDEQLHRLQREFSMPILLTMGLYDTDHQFPEGTGWTAMNCDDMLFGRQMHGVLLSQACPSYDELPERLHRLIQYTKREAKTGARHRPYIYERKSLTPKEEVIYSLLASIRGIRGKDAVCSKLARNHTLSRLFSLPVKGWVAEGFTKATATKIVARLEEIHG